MLRWQLTNFNDNFVFISISSGGFQLSPDFRQRASSNASSCGRLSPIPSVVDLEPSWSYAALAQDFDNPVISSHKIQTNDAVRLTQNATLDQLAGSLADDLTLQNEFLQGYLFNVYIACISLMPFGLSVENANFLHVVLLFHNS